MRIKLPVMILNIIIKNIRNKMVADDARRPFCDQNYNCEAKGLLSHRVWLFYGFSILLPNFLLLALRRQPIQPQFMALNFESVFHCRVLLDRFNAHILELDDGTATGADQMIAISVWGLLFKACEAIRKPALFGKPGFCSSFNVRYIYWGETFSRGHTALPRSDAFRPQ
jgi:hypothetical protein